MPQFDSESYQSHFPGSVEEYPSGDGDGSFAALIGSRVAMKEKGLQQVELFEAENNGARVTGRSPGGYIEHAYLVGPDGKPVSVLFADPDITKVRPDASFMAYPFGPSDAPGGQHGSPRWSDFHRFNDLERPHAIVMQAEQPDVRGSTVRRIVDLPEPNILVIQNEVGSNITTASEATSIAEHLYFPADETMLDRIRINGERITKVIPEEIVGKVLKGGEAFHWKEAPDTLQVQFADGREIEVSAAASVIRETGRGDGDKDEVPVAASYVIWHRPGTDSICIEPVIGFRDGKGDNLHIPPGGSALLTVALRVK